MSKKRKQDDREDANEIFNATFMITIITTTSKTSRVLRLSCNCLFKVPHLTRCLCNSISRV